MSENRHFTTRRGFITGMGFGAVGLYGVWAAYGAAPLPFGNHHETLHQGHGDAAGTLGHAGADHDAGSAMTPEAFRREHAAFVDRFKRPDGSVEPVAGQAVSHDTGHHDMNAHDMGHHDVDAHDMGYHDMDAHGAGHHDMNAHGAEDGHDMSGHAMSHTAHGADADQPVDLYLLAFMWGYNPDILRLRTGVRYRLRMMADDITHGASFQLGAASRIIRLRPDSVSDQIITFTKPGTVLIYCTVYCGAGHDQMQGKIIVTASEQGGQP